VAAFQSFAESEMLHLRQLLDQSDQRLTPLSDPLRLSIRKHRWLDLRRECEESYTDWLAWLLQAMGSAEAVLKVFGLDGTAFGAQVCSAPPRVDREEIVSACSGENKRLDLVIRFGEMAKPFPRRAEANYGESPSRLDRWHSSYPMKKRERPWPLPRIASGG
jgi:hypothetical protein